MMFISYDVWIKIYKLCNLKKEMIYKKHIIPKSCNLNPLLITANVTAVAIIGAVSCFVS